MSIRVNAPLFGDAEIIIADEEQELKNVLLSLNVSLFCFVSLFFSFVKTWAIDLR
jgi:hypothetical protein